MATVQTFFTNLKNRILEVYENTIAGFIRSIFSKPSSILFLGIDNAGKTTLLHKLKEDVTNTYEPTHHPMNSEIEIGNMKANIMDLGGHTSARLAWQEFFYNCDGIVFIVDVNDTKRYYLVQEVYQSVREIQVGKKKPPIAVLMNKIDLIKHDSNSILQNQDVMDQIQKETGIENDDSMEQPVLVTYVSLLNESITDMSSPILQSFQWLDKMIHRRPEEL